MIMQWCGYQNLQPHINFKCLKSQTTSNSMLLHVFSFFTRIEITCDCASHCSIPSCEYIYIYIRTKLVRERNVSTSINKLNGGMVESKKTTKHVCIFMTSYMVTTIVTTQAGNNSSICLVEDLQPYVVPKH